MDKHSTLDPVMVSVVSSIAARGNLVKFFKPLDVNFGLKCKCDLIVKNSNICIFYYTQVVRIVPWTEAQNSI